MIWHPMIMPTMIRPPKKAARGFTLIELLIVISILGLLAAVLLPGIFGVSEAAKVTATEANMIQLDQGCQSFNRKHGYFPPDDLKLPGAAIKTGWKPENGTNTGIESFVVFVSQSQQGGHDLNGMAEHFRNTDGDQHGAELPLLKTTARIEIADAWQVPIAYFTKFGMGKTQHIMTAADTEPIDAKAKLREGQTYFGHGKFQFLSAGPDLIFGSVDDIVWPAN